MLGESHGQRGLKGYSPWGCKQLDMTEVTWHSTLESSLITFSSSADGSYTGSLGSGLWKTEPQLLSEPDGVSSAFIHSLLSFLSYFLMIVHVRERTTQSGNKREVRSPVKAKNQQNHKM